MERDRLNTKKPSLIVFFKIQEEVVNTLVKHHYHEYPFSSWQTIQIAFKPC